MNKVLVLRHWRGGTESFGAEVVLVDERELLRRGAVLYEVHSPEGVEVYDDLYSALLSLWYAQEEGAVLYALDREGRPVARVALDEGGAA